MAELRQTQIASLIKRAGFNSFVDTTSPQEFQATVAELRREIEESGLDTKEANARMGALAKAVELFNNQIEGYMPMVRYGDWTVRVSFPTSKDASERPLVFMVANEREAVKLAGEMRQRYKGAQVAHMATQQLTPEALGRGNREDILDAAHMLVDTALSMKKSRAGTEEALAALGNAVRNAKLELAVTGLRARSVRRRDIAGHIRPDESGTYLRNAVRPYLSQLSNHIAYNMVSPALNDALSTLNKSGMFDLSEYARANMIDAYLEPDIWVARAKAFAFTWTLGFNMSSALINLTQLPVLTIPTLAATHGYGKAAAQTMRALRDVSRSLEVGQIASLRSAEAFNRDKAFANLAPDEQQVLQAALDMELIGQGLTTETSGLFTPEGVRGAGATRFFRGISGFVTLAGKMFGTVEQMNRAASLLAAYRLAKQADPAALKKFLDRSYSGGEGGYPAYAGNLAAQYAASIVEQTQGVFNKANRPAWQQGAWGIPFQFLQFPAFMMETMARTLAKDAEGRRFIATPEGLKMMGGMFGALFAFGGLMAFPMAETLDKLIELLGKALKPYGINMPGLEKAIRESVFELSKMAGASQETAANVSEVFARGPMRQTGIDISRRVAVDIPIVDTAMGTGLVDMFGPTSSVTIGALVAANDYMREGQNLMAVLQLLPVAVRNAVRADILAGGLTSELGLAPRGGGDIISRAGMPLLGTQDRATGAEALLTGLGVAPTRFSRTREAVEAERSYAEKMQPARERFNNQMADFIFFAQQAEAAGRGDEAQRWRESFQRKLQETVAEDRGKTDPNERVIKDANTFRTALAQRLEQRRTGATGPAGVVRGKETQFLAERATQYIPR